MVGCWKDLGFGQISLSYNFPIVQNFVFLMFKWKNVKRVCITHTFDRIVIFHMSWEFRLIQGFYWFYRYCIVCAHFIIIKHIVWYRNKPVVLLKRLKTDLCRSNFDFHQNTNEIFSKLNMFLSVTQVIIFLNVDYMFRSRWVDHEITVKVIKLPLIITLDHSKSSGRSWSDLP